MLNHMKKKIGHSTYEIVRAADGIGFVITEMYVKHGCLEHGFTQKRFYTVEEAIEELKNIRNERAIIGDGYIF